MYKKARLLIAGDCAITVEFGNRINPLINRKVVSFREVLEEKRPYGYLESVPSYRSVLVYFDSDKVYPDEFCAVLSRIIENLAISRREKARLQIIPVCYGGDFGPDLPFVSKNSGLSVEEVIELHCSADYLIYMLGFTPGYPYMGGLDERLSMPRLDTPRKSVPAGTVAIAGNQTGIYSLPSPGGWRLLGKTPLSLFNPKNDPPALLKAGDYVRFRAVDKQEYLRLETAVIAGEDILETREINRSEVDGDTDS